MPGALVAPASLGHLAEDVYLRLRANMPQKKKEASPNVVIGQWFLHWATGVVS